MSLLIDPTVVPNSRVEVSRQDLHHNLRALKQMMEPSRICMIIKSHAYGHGIPPVVEAAEEFGIREFATFSAQSAEVAKRHLTQDSALHIMGQIDPRDLPWAFRSGIKVWIHDLTRWEAVLALAKDGTVEVPARVHLELETGMNRTGLRPDHALAIAERITELDGVELDGVCTHLAGAESQRNADRVQGQVKQYNGFLDRLDEAGIDPGTRHVCSSAAAMMFPELRFDMVRLGIACYGYWPTPEVRVLTEPLGTWRPRPTMQWISSIMSVTEVEEGEWIGYGMSYQALDDARIAVVPVGYGDGLTRGLSNLGYVIIHGSRCPIVGFVNMNMIQVDITHLPEADRGDDVVLIGRQGECEITVRSFAEANDIVNYELMTRLSLDIPRYLVD